MSMPISGHPMLKLLQEILKEIKGLRRDLKK